MSGLVITLDASIHRTVQMLLPWFAADRLNTEERAMVQAHLEICTRCKADVDWQRKLQMVEPGRIAALDVDHAWSQLLPQLDGVRPRPRRRTFSELVRHLWPSDPSWMRWALAAQMVLIVGLISITIPQYGERAAYHVLGAPGSSASNVVVVFKPSTTEQDLRRILQANGARVADGPTATGAYLLKISDTRLTSAISELRSEPAVVLAESLESAGNR
jgi:anti-sigma factor RsiW